MLTRREKFQTAFDGMVRLEGELKPLIDEIIALGNPSCELPLGERQAKIRELQASEAEVRLPPTGSRNHRPDGPGTDQALTFMVDHSKGANQTSARLAITVAISCSCGNAFRRP